MTRLPVRCTRDGWSVDVSDGQSAALVVALAAGEPLSCQLEVRTVALQGSWRGAAPPADLAERPIAADQTQRSVIVGDRMDAVVVKWTIQPTWDPSPAPVLTGHLAAVGFDAQPPPRGELRTPDGILLAFVTGYLPGAQDGWDWYVDDVRAHARGSAVDVLTPATEVGRLTAELHVALATRSEVFPSPRSMAEATTTSGWLTRAEDVLDEAVAVTDGPEGQRLRVLAPAARHALAAMAVDETPVQPIHGDLHVGQILRWHNGYAVNDFDGNPVLPPIERLTSQPVARDVAGMLQSLDHVGRVAVRHARDADRGIVDTWISEARQAFLETYRLVLAEHNSSELLDERLLVPFAVEQECREYVYAARHLPRWLYVPDAALPALLTG